MRPHASALRIQKFYGTGNHALELDLGLPRLLDRRALVLRRLPQLCLQCHPLFLRWRVQSGSSVGAPRRALSRDSLPVAQGPSARCSGRPAA
ncbi:MAG: hypothetical protein H0U67_01470 [Gemmatimonadetes bacterium]|nr:hypothetical protein [Gemmatimonadota bacterium]